MKTWNAPAFRAAVAFKGWNLSAFTRNITLHLKDAAIEAPTYETVRSRWAMDGGTGPVSHPSAMTEATARLLDITEDSLWTIKND